MHHYPFHVGDYIRATAHLDIVEDCIYRRLIDLYMETELPIPNETQQVIRRLRLGSSGLILETILREFFTLDADNCWHNSRCDQELLEFKRLAEVSRNNGKLGGRPKKTQQVILANPDVTQTKPAGLQPIPNTQYPIPKENTVLSPPATPKADPIPYQRIIDLYHEKLPTLRRVVMLTAKRKGQIAARWRTGLPDLKTWADYFEHCGESAFLMGNSEPTNGHKRFVADLEWITNETNFAKIAEGKYHQ